MPQAIVAAFLPSLVGTFAGTVLTSVIGLGLSMGLQFLQAELFGPKPKKPEDLQGLFRQSVGPRSRHYGRVRVGGYVVFIETKSRALYQIVVHGQGPITAYIETYIDNRKVTLEDGTSGGVTTAPFKPTKQIIDTQLGNPGVSGWTRLNTEFPDIWSTSHKLERLAASLLYTASVKPEDVSKVYPNRIPILNRVIDGAKCYDPRTGSTAFTKNAAVILRDYLTHPDGMKIPASLIDDDKFEAAADVCDENVTIKAGGTIKRYEIGMSYSFEDEPRNVINRVINACDGRLYFTAAGKIGFDAGKWVAPTVTISDEAGHIISANLRDASGPFRDANEIIVKYTHVEAGYKEATSDPWRDEDSISQLGEVRSQLLTAYEIQHHNHARRVAKIVQKRASPRWQGTIVTNLYGLNAWDQRWINLILPDYDIDGTFEIIGPPALDTETMTITLQVASFESNTYSFNAATEEGTAPTVPEEREDEDVPQPTSVTTSAIERKLSEVEIDDTIYDPGTGENWTDSSTKNIIAYVARIAWAPPPGDDLEPEAEFSLDAINWLNLPVAKENNFTETPAMPRPSNVRLRVRFKTVGGSTSEWSYGTNVSIPS